MHTNSIIYVERIYWSIFNLEHSRIWDNVGHWSGYFVQNNQLYFVKKKNPFVCFKSQALWCWRYKGCLLGTSKGRHTRSWLKHSCMITPADRSYPGPWLNCLRGKLIKVSRFFSTKHLWFAKFLKDLVVPYKIFAADWIIFVGIFAAASPNPIQNWGEILWLKLSMRIILQNSNTCM